MEKWEYLTFTAAYSDSNHLGIVKIYNNQEMPDWKQRRWGVDSALLELGEQGWELITVMWRKTGESTYADPVYYFKRLKD